jgi:hypothetical protein
VLGGSGGLKERSGSPPVNKGLEGTDGEGQVTR